MVASSWPEALRRVRTHEGGNVDDKRDPGGRTGRGVTQQKWNEYRKLFQGKNLPADVWAASQADVDNVFKVMFWDKLKCDDLPAGVDYAVFDYGVNSGEGRAGRVLRRAMGLPDTDWAVTSQVIGRAKAVNDNALAAAVCDERLAFLKTLKTWPVYKNGWTTRVTEVRTASVMMASANDNVKAAPRPAVVPGQPPWLLRMNSILGLYELSGQADNPVIIGMARACNGKIAKTYLHDSIAWCALTVNYVLISSGFAGDDSLWALDFGKYGKKLSGPAVGAIATKKRYEGGKLVGGHVFLVVGRTADGRLVGRGGNQSDMVCDEVFSPSDITGYNWPDNYAEPVTGISALPVVSPSPKVRRDVKLPPATPLHAEETGKGEVAVDPKLEATLQTGNATAGAGVATEAASQGLEWWAIMLIVLVLCAVVGAGVYFGLRWWRNRQQNAPVAVDVVSEDSGDNRSEELRELAREGSRPIEGRVPTPVVPPAAPPERRKRRKKPAAPRGRSSPEARKAPARGRATARKRKASRGAR